MIFLKNYILSPAEFLNQRNSIIMIIDYYMAQSYSLWNHVSIQSNALFSIVWNWHACCCGGHVSDFNWAQEALTLEHDLHREEGICIISSYRKLKKTRGVAAINQVMVPAQHSTIRIMLVLSINFINDRRIRFRLLVIICRTD